jgi:hypothetical protein
MITPVTPVTPKRPQGRERPPRPARTLGVPDRFLQPARLETPPAHAHRRLRTPYRRHGWLELAFLAALYVLYDVSRFVVAGQQGTAFARGRSLLRLEQTLNLAWEQTVNRFVSAHFVLAVTADYSYAALHYVITPVVLLWMWRAHRAAYPRARTVLLLTTAAGLVAFALMPVAPPRMLPGFVDTMARFSGVGWWGADASAPRGFGGLTNQFAAMPSLHVAWALWCGWQLVRHAQHSVVRALGVLYPLLITIVVIATGNHYLLDAVAGVAVVFIAIGAVRAVGRLQLVASWSLQSELAVRGELDDVHLRLLQPAGVVPVERLPAGQLVPLGIGCGVVDADHAGAYPAAEREGLLRVARVDRGGQPVAGGVGRCDGLGHRAVRRDASEWTERLLDVEDVARTFTAAMLSPANPTAERRARPRAD